MKDRTVLALRDGRVVSADAAKGLCMLIIIAGHVGMSWMPESVMAARVLLFFMLSGFFFPSGASVRAFLAEKSRRLLIPYVIFYLLSYLIFYVARRFVPGFDGMTEARGILDMFWNKHYFNGPLWFLTALFFVQMLSWLTDRISNSAIISAVVHLALGAAGFSLNTLDVNLPMALDSALTAMPFFYLGRIVGKVDFKLSLRNAVLSAVVMIAAVLAFSLFPFRANMALNRYDCQLPTFFLIGAAVCIGYYILAYLISAFVPLLGRCLAYVGYHSLFIMCTHHLVYRFFEYILSGTMDDGLRMLVVYSATLAVCLSAAPLVGKYMPALVGRRRGG